MQTEFTTAQYGVIKGSAVYKQVEAVARVDFMVNMGTPGLGLAQ